MIEFKNGSIEKGSKLFLRLGFSAMAVDIGQKCVVESLILLLVIIVRPRSLFRV
jgi:hypothetical protein